MKFLNQIDGADKLIENPDHRLVTDIEKAEWNGKANSMHKHAKADITDFPVSMPANGGNAATVNGKTVLENVPLGAKFTDTNTTYTAGNNLTLVGNEFNAIDTVPTKANVEKALGFSVNKSVPANALFTDTNTITTVNGKTGAISREDILALGVSGSDTVYVHPSTHPYSMITGAPTSLPANGGNSSTVNGKSVLTDVPSGAVFTDTITTINNKTGAILKADIVALGIPGADTNTVTTVNGKTGAILKADIVALGIPAQDTVVDISGKADKSQVLTNVPVGAKFTDTNTTYTAGTNMTLVGTEFSAIDTVPTKSNVEAALGFSVNKSVPSNALFTDTNTVTTVNGKTGVITKQDIVALGISEANTIYIHPSAHPASMITEEANKRFMNDAERSKLGGIAAGANNYVLEAHSAAKHTDINQALMTTSAVQFAKIGVGTASPNFEVDLAGDARIREGGSLKMGGVGAADVGFEMKFDKVSNSVNFNFFS